MRLILIIHKYMNRLNKGHYHHPKVKCVHLVETMRLKKNYFFKLLKNTKIKQKSENDVKKKFI